MKSTTKRIIYLIFVISAVLVINGLIHSIWNLWNKQHILTEAKVRLEAEKSEHAKLRRELSYVQTDAFVEAEARDKLFMVKPGETEVLIQKELLPSEAVILNRRKAAVWEQWVNLFN